MISGTIFITLGLLFLYVSYKIIRNWKQIKERYTFYSESLQHKEFVEKKQQEFNK